jgi:deoxyribose-phosphate aldolase
MTISIEEFVRRVDHSLLKPQLSIEEVKQGCEFAKETNCATVCVNPTSITIAKEVLNGTNTGICTVIGFPFGTHTSYIKAKETEEAYKLGAVEMDMVINIGALKSKQYDFVKKDIEAVVKASPAIVKVILEMCYLNQEEKIAACKLCEEAGANYVKTSTGFATSGATLDDIRLMRKSVSSKVKVKAAGGIRTLDFSLQLIEAGADRIGISATRAILKELKK